MTGMTLDFHQRMLAEYLKDHDEPCPACGKRIQRLKPGPRIVLVIACWAPTLANIVFFILFVS
jgi:hypothetical protein